MLEEGLTGDPAKKRGDGGARKDQNLSDVSNRMIKTAWESRCGAHVLLANYIDRSRTTKICYFGKGFAARPQQVELARRAHGGGDNTPVFILLSKSLNLDHFSTAWPETGKHVQAGYDNEQLEVNGSFSQPHSSFSAYACGHYLPFNTTSASKYIILTDV
ncbi:hypothetical protein BC629DRAFT_703243 [Irpex lacteus]|nr:hypothetical protein BC629DRAFT_703243 [Irpex lacteus]